MPPKPQKMCHICHLHYSLVSYEKHVIKCEEMYNVKMKKAKES